MKVFKCFKNRQYQLHISRNEKYKHRSMKSREIDDLFTGKIAYTPMLFRNTGRYPIENKK